jgi:hypothetical protein
MLLHCYRGTIGGDGRDLCMLRTLCALASDAIGHYHNGTRPDQ